MKLSEAIAERIWDDEACRPGPDTMEEWAEQARALENRIAELETLNRQLQLAGKVLNHFDGAFQDLADK